jgi:hypothetical protein
MTRNEKILFLTRLFTGKASIKEILPADLLIKIGYGDTAFFIDGKKADKEVFDKKMKSQLSEDLSENIINITYGDKNL